MTLNQAVFMILAVVAAAAAIGVVWFESPVRSALSLVLNFFVLAFLYFLLGAQLLGITQIMVYAGAIMVLFLFVIMMLTLRQREARAEQPDRKPAVSLLVGVALFVSVLAAVVAPIRDVVGTRVPDSYGSPQEVGYALFTTYAWPFEVTSILLLVGIVGSIVLAKRRL